MWLLKIFKNHVIDIKEQLLRDEDKGHESKTVKKFDSTFKKI